jgi:hypothetical protein
MRRVSIGRLISLSIPICVLLISPNVFGETLKSANYRLDETSIGSGGLIQSSSSNYQTRSTAGDLGVGNSNSSNYQIEAGSQTTSDPTLSFALISPTTDFGNFSATSTSTSTASFSVVNYTSYGYVVQISGGSLTNGAHSISPMSTIGSPVTGVNQFGINLTANTTPTAFGASPDNGQFGFGVVEAGYSTPNLFKFVDGDVIAHAPKSSGKTIYTISYIVNVEPLTPGGQYSAGQTIIITGTY